MKTKNIWIWGAVVIAVTVVMTWVCHPEYGKGYSEDQRRNWNEMNWYEMTNLTADSDPVKRDPSALRSRRAHGDAPEWEIDFSKPVVKLPLQGMVLPELERLAEQGNGDACLELAFRVRSTGNEFEIYSIEKNVRKAVKSGRAGSDYLLRLLEHSKATGKGVKGSDVEGYADFVSLLGKGDFMLGKVYACLIQGDDYAMNKLDAGLRERARRGDVEALRNAGYLGILRKSVLMPHVGWESKAFLPGGMYDDSLKKMMGLIDKGVKALPVFLKPSDTKVWEIDFWMIEKVTADYWRELQRSLEPSFAMLLQAAEQGDLHAKFLWTNYFIQTKHFLSRDEWERHLRYMNELIAAGGIYRGDHPQDFDWDLFPLVEYFYQEKSMSNLLQSIKKQKFKEYSAFKKRPDMPDALHGMDMKAWYDMNGFTRYLVSDVDVLGKHELSKEEQQYGYQLLEEAANEGDAQAMFWLAKLLNAGLIVEQDISRSWKLLEKSKAWCDGIKNKHDTGYIYLMFGVGVTLDDAIEWQMLDVVSRHGDMPGMTVKQAFDQFAQEYVKKRRYIPEEIKDQLEAQFEKRGYQVPKK